ncbi:ABC transporter ATP-binding protein [Algimonas porphyrae]|nr:ABC transporter ATP-binding protein [Algimonas porphyrae]
MDTAIATTGLRRHFGQVKAVDGVALHVPAGSVFGFLGPNGSGKTTTIRLLLGLIRADAGQVRINGVDLAQDRRAALSGVGAIVETPALYPNLTGRELLRVAALLLNPSEGEIDRVLDIVGLRDAAARRIGDYSLGMRQRLALARALMGRPRLLVLDEPTNGLDPAGIADMRKLITELPTRSGTTVFISSHQLSEIQQICTDCALIKSGQLVSQGPLGALMAQAPSRLEIETDSPAKAQEIARQQMLDALGTDNGLVVQSPLDQGARARLVKALVEAGCAVSQVTQRETSLEQLFLTLTTDGPDGNARRAAS